MSIDICCRTDGTVTEPCLDFFKADTLCEQERSAAMAKIVESEFRHIVLFQNGRHMSRKITGLNQLSHFVHIDVPLILLAVATTTQYTVPFLVSFHFEKKLLKRFHQRKRPEAGFCFGAVSND